MIDVVSILRRSRFRFSNEADLQAGIAEALTRADVAFEREVRLSTRDRVDFLVGPSLALEIKVDGAPSAVLRQLMRYAMCPRIGRIVLATTRSQHRQLPGSVNDKPLDVVCLAGGIA